MSGLSPLLRKELRLLFPSFVVAMVLAISPYWLLGGKTPNESMDWIALLAFGIGAVLVAVTPFGQEFNGGTFSNLLAQPTPRSRTWEVKTSLVAAALAMVFVALVVTRQAIYYRVNWTWVERIPYFFFPENRGGFEEWSFFITLLALSGGLWTTLMFRQIGAAMFFTVLIPLATLVSWGLIWQCDYIWADSTLVLTLYAGGALLWSRRAFLRIQDAQRLSQPVSFPGRRPTSVAESLTAGTRRRTPIRALLVKEILLHQISMFVGCSLLAFHLGALVLRGLSTRSLPSEARILLAVAPLLWLFLPWLIGSVAVAEERRQGTLVGQLCLPVTRRQQFVVKLGMALALGFLMGGLAPWALEALGMVFHIPSPLFTVTADVALPDWFYAALSQSFVLVLVVWSALAVLSAFLAFFCSSLAHHMLHALAAAGLAVPALWALIVWTQNEIHQKTPLLWKGPLVFLIGGVTLLTALAAVSFVNSRQPVAGRRLWMRSLEVLLAAVLCGGIVSAVVYQRPWERLLPIEPPQHTAQLDDAVPPKICWSEETIAALLPDGRIWTAQKPQGQTSPHVHPSNAALAHAYAEYAHDGYDLDIVAVNPPIQAPIDGKIRSDTYWMDLACQRFWPTHGKGDGVSHEDVGLAAVQADGSLWVFGWHENNDVVEQAGYDWQRVGSDTDWRAVGASGSGLIVLRKDGSRWELRRNAAHLPAAARTMIYYEPYGTDSDLRFDWQPFTFQQFWVHPLWSLVRTKEGAIAATEKSTLLFSGLSSPVSHRSNWIASASTGFVFTALAADGAICTWGQGLYTGSGSILTPSRRPLWCLNVLADSSTGEGFAPSRSK